LVYEIIGQRDKAITAVGNAYRAGYSMVNLQHEPELKKLRTDPRFKELAANPVPAPVGSGL